MYTLSCHFIQDIAPHKFLSHHQKQNLISGFVGSMIYHQFATSAVTTLQWVLDHNLPRVLDLTLAGHVTGGHVTGH